MAKKLAVLIIHGMGSQEIGFSEKMIEELGRRVNGLGKDSNLIAWKPIFWADILEPKQVAFLREAQANNDMDYIKLRKFVISALSDAVAYQKVDSEKNHTYDLIHRRVKEKIDELFNVDLARKSCPLIILAHSLGGHIMSNYIWDIQNSKTDLTGFSDFEKFEYLAGMITFGCNIPLFTFAYRNVVPIRFPGNKLEAEYVRNAKWLNYYDPDDVLGYPLKQINADYNKVVAEDISINVGGALTSWSPASHSDYWTDDDFTKSVSQFIRAFI
ncbi:MAG: hypothetical protein U1B30_12490 [Pseudomonadota bacterium]|nr:hypothetical protein [Pseudomonadota bacterium]